MSNSNGIAAVFRLKAAQSDGLVAAAPVVRLRVIFRRFWPLTKSMRGWLWLCAFLLILAPALDAAIVWLFKVLVDDVLTPKNFALFPLIAAFYIGVTLAYGAVSFFDQYLSAWVGERFILVLRATVFAHVQTLSPDFTERSKLGDLIARITSDVEAIESLLLGMLADAFTNLVKIAMFTAVLFYLSWQLAAVSLISVPVFLLVARWFSARIKRASRERRRRSGSIGVVAEENLANTALVQAYGRESSELERFGAENFGSFVAEMAATRLRAIFRPLADMVEVVGVMLIMALGIWQLSRGQLTLGGLLAFVAYLSSLYSPVQAMGRLGNSVFAATASAERILELLNEKPTVSSPAQPVRFSEPVRGIVLFDDVGFRYRGRDTDALDSVTFLAHPGQIVALVGLSGAGKSTVGKLLLRFYDPTRGRISLDGHDLRSLDLADLRSHLAVVLQETLIFDASIGENIRWGRPDATDLEVEEAARAAAAHEFITALPEGYQTRVGQRGRALSGGQRQRIALARAMIRHASVLLMDEPTTGLDAEASANILTPIRAALSRRTVLVATHDLAVVRDADQILFFEAGRIVESGTHDALMAAAGRYADLYRLRGSSALGLDSPISPDSPVGSDSPSRAESSPAERRTRPSSVTA